LNIVVFVKPVPDPAYYHKISVDPVKKTLMRDGIPAVINPTDQNALEYALNMKEQYGGNVIVISMAPLFSQGVLKKCLAMGADKAYLISDKAFGGADTFSTSYTLSKAMEKTGVKADLLLCGNESADGATSHVPSQIGEWLGCPHIANVSSIEIADGKALVSKKMESGSITYKVKLPALFAVGRDSNSPRLATAYGIVMLRDKKIEILTKDDLDVDGSMIGLEGSPTQAGELITLNMKRSSKEITGDEKEIAQEIYSLIKKSGICIQGGMENAIK